MLLKRDSWPQGTVKELLASQSQGESGGSPGEELYSGDPHRSARFHHTMVAMVTWSPDANGPCSPEMKMGLQGTSDKGSDAVGHSSRRSQWLEQRTQETLKVAVGPVRCRGERCPSAHLGVSRSRRHRALR